MGIITIETFEVKNYKPIQNSGPISIGDMTTFIGKNDAGKSSFLEALNLFLEDDKPYSFGELDYPNPLPPFSSCKLVTMGRG